MGGHGSSQAAVQFFNRSFIDTSRLACEIAQPIGDPNLPRPWSRYSQGSSAHAKVSDGGKQSFPAGGEQPPKASTEATGEQASEDPQLLEFLHVMQPRSKSKLWADDTVEINKQAGKGSKQNSSKGKSEKKSKERNNESGKKAKSKGSQERGRGEGIGNVSYEDESAAEAAVSETSGGGVIDMEAPSGNVDDWVGDETVSDVDYLRRRTKTTWSDEDENNELPDSENESHLEEDADLVGLKEQPLVHAAAKEEKSADMVNVDKEDIEEDSPSARDPKPTQVSAEQQESVAETGRLFVRNLSYTTSEEDLEHLFGQYGKLSQVHLVLDKETRRSKGFAYILYMLPECAVRAMEALDKSTFQGRLLHILAAKRLPPLHEKDLEINAGVPGRSQFKKDREAQKRALEASGNTLAWNSLFMRSDTVAENAARKYNMSKSDFLDPEAEDLAVRLALGETQIIAETKKALGNEGVNVEVLEDLASGNLEGIKRSNRVILVKNLPYMTMETDLVEMFGKFGSLERVILPPTKTISLVVYLEASEARSAFKGLAYKRFKHVPLYLEWAPDNILLKRSSKNMVLTKEGPTVPIGQDQVKRVVLEHQLMMPTDADVELDTESRSVFVKNLNFKTTESVLRNHFEQNLTKGSLRSVKIKTKLGKSGIILSSGFGFIEFDTPETAKTVCKQLQGTVLEEHALVLQLSHGKKDINATEMGQSLEKPINKKSSTKLIVRNVAFEATKKDLQQLFNPFGQLKSLRLPKKFDGNHRGFAFLEFSTKQEAENAYNALSSTHLYGRHLVLERAKEDENLEELRARTASQFSEEVKWSDGNARPLKKHKHTILDTDMRSG